MEEAAEASAVPALRVVSGTPVLPRPLPPLCVASWARVPTITGLQRRLPRLLIKLHKYLMPNY